MSNKRHVAVVKVTNSLKSVVPLLMSVSEATPYCAVMWDDSMIIGCFDYFGTESNLTQYMAKVKLDTARLGFNFVDSFHEVTKTPQASYGNLVRENVNSLLKIPGGGDVMGYAQSCLKVAARNLRQALTYNDIEEALASYDMVVSSIATIKLRQVSA